MLHRSRTLLTGFLVIRILHMATSVVQRPSSKADMTYVIREVAPLIQPTILSSPSETGRFFKTGNSSTGRSLNPKILLPMDPNDTDWIPVNLTTRRPTKPRDEDEPLLPSASETEVRVSYVGHRGPLPPDKDERSWIEYAESSPEVVNSTEVASSAKESSQQQDSIESTTTSTTEQPFQHPHKYPSSAKRPYSFYGPEDDHYIHEYSIPSRPVPPYPYHLYFPPPPPPPRPRPRSRRPPPIPDSRETHSSHGRRYPPNPFASGSTSSRRRPPPPHIHHDDIDDDDSYLHHSHGYPPFVEVHAQGPGYIPFEGNPIGHEDDGEPTYKYDPNAVPACATNNSNATYCAQDSEYPIAVLEYAMDHESYKLHQLYPDSSPSTQMEFVDGIAPEEEQKYTIDHYLKPSEGDSVGQESSNSNTSQLHYNQEYFKEGGYICPSTVQYIKPQRAQNIRGKWKILINIPENYDGGNYSQVVRIEKCASASMPCSFTDEKYMAFCVQKYNVHRLLAWNEDKGLHIDAFKLPVACSCHFRKQHDVTSASVAATSKPASER